MVSREQRPASQPSRGSQVVAGKEGMVAGGAKRAAARREQGGAEGGRCAGRGGSGARATGQALQTVPCTPAALPHGPNMAGEQEQPPESRSTRPCRPDTAQIPSAAAHMAAPARHCLRTLSPPTAAATAPGSAGVPCCRQGRAQGCRGEAAAAGRLNVWRRRRWFPPPPPPVAHRGHLQGNISGPVLSRQIQQTGVSCGRRGEESVPGTRAGFTRTHLGCRGRLPGAAPALPSPN